MSVEFDDLLPVSLSMVLEGCCFDCDFYLVGRQGKPETYRKRGNPFTATDLKGLRTRKAKCLYIATADSKNYHEHVWSRILTNDQIPIQERLKIVFEASKEVVEEAWCRGSANATVCVARDIAEQLTELVTNDDLLFHDLVDLMATDDTAYAHATNVCSFALLIAKANGIDDRETLAQVAMGALLHDSGKDMAQEVLDGQSTPAIPNDARQLGKTHPTIGFKRFAQCASMPWAALMAIYQHHERIDGKGFPVGAVGDEIHEAAKICAVANYYEKQWFAQQKHNRVDIDRLCTALANQSETMLDGDVASAMISIVASQHATSA